MPENWKAAIVAWGITHFNPSVTPSCGITPTGSMTQAEEFKPLLASLASVLYLPLELEEQLTAMHVCTQNTGGKFSPHTDSICLHGPAPCCAELSAQVLQEEQ